MIFAIKVRKSYTICIRTYAVERSKSCAALNRTPSNSPASRGESNERATTNCFESR